jgi:hypothetical protein
MNPKQEIADQVRDLIAYFPGRGRYSFVWLFFLPFASTLFFTQFFGDGGSPVIRTLANIPPGSLPFTIFCSSGTTTVGLYTVTILILLLRIAHSDRSSWMETASIVASSTIYGLIVSLPSLLVDFAFSARYAGISILSIFQTGGGLIATIGAFFLLMGVAGALAHYTGFFIPLFLFIARSVYPYFLPAAYAIKAMPEPWRLIDAAFPLSPAIVILRTGFLNHFTSESVSLLYWIAAGIHAALGFALAYWFWKSISKPSSPVPGTPDATGISEPLPV